MPPVHETACIPELLRYAVLLCIVAACALQAAGQPGADSAAGAHEWLSTPRFRVAGDPATGELTVVIRDAQQNEICMLPFPLISVDDAAQTGIFVPKTGQADVGSTGAMAFHVKRLGDRAIALTWECVDAQPHRLRIRWRDDSDFYGGGERFNALNQKGHVVPIASRDHPGAKGLAAYKPVPFFMSTAGYGFWIDSSLEGTCDLNLAVRDVVELAYTAKSLRLVLLAGPTMPEILDAYTEQTGRPRVPPPWAFAPWKSRDVHNNRQEVLEDVEKMRELDLPASVLVIDSPWETGYNNFELNEEQFAEPEPLFARVKELGFYVCFWLTPFINVRNVTDMHGIDPGTTSTFAEAAGKGLLVRGADGKPLIMPWWKGEGAMVDFTNPDAVAWWHDQLRKTLRWGARAFKCDDGEANYVGDAVFHDGDSREMRNRYCLAYLKAMQDYVDTELDGDGVLNARSGFAGMQRYPFCWAGDNEADFSHENGLPTAILAGQNAALSGVPLWGHDIAGYFGRPTPEVFARWTQFGAFSPLMLVHMTSNLGPWDFDARTLAIYRTYAKLHMRLFPYIYEAAHESARTGLPIIRPMVLACPGNREAAQYIYQYLFGPDLLVAPLETGGTSKRVYLPEGQWVDFWSGEAIAGGQVLTVEAPLEKLPLFARSGALIEMLPDDVDTLIERSPAIAADVVCLDDRRVVQVWPGAPRVLHTWDGVRVSAAIENGRKVLDVQADPPRPLEVCVMYRRVEPEIVGANTSVQTRFDARQRATVISLRATETPQRVSWPE